jgi:hypothetical protein
LVATLLLAFSPFHAKNAGTTDAVVTFANHHWNGATAACTTTVAAGASQPSYQCAAFTARSLATDGSIPGLSNVSVQSAYGSYKPGNGKTSDLLAIPPGIAGAGIGTLADFLTTYGYVTNGLLRKFAASGDTFPDEDDASPPEKLQWASGSISSVCLISRPA